LEKFNPPAADKGRGIKPLSAFGGLFRRRRIKPKFLSQADDPFLHLVVPLPLGPSDTIERIPGCQGKEATR